MHAYVVILSPEPNLGGYSVSCPAMPGAFSQGPTRDAALAAMRESAQAWLEAMGERGEGPLEETTELVAQAVADILEDRAAEGWDLLIETAVLTIPVASAA